MGEEKERRDVKGSLSLSLSLSLCLSYSLECNDAEEDSDEHHEEQPDGASRPVGLDRHERLQDQRVQQPGNGKSAKGEEEP